MKLLRTPRKKPHARQAHAAILFGIGAFSFLIAAEEVDEIRDMAGLQSVSAATMGTSVAKIKSTFKKRGQPYLVVDGSLHFQMMPSKATRLMLLRNQPVAVTVDSIDRMTEIGRVLTLPKTFTGPERNWYRGLAIVNDKVIPIVNGKAFLSAAEQGVANSVLGHLTAKGVRA
jgi:chemotaxis signal transduction protein